MGSSNKSSKSNKTSKASVPPNYASPAYMPEKAENVAREAKNMRGHPNPPPENRIRPPRVIKP